MPIEGGGRSSLKEKEKREIKRARRGTPDECG